MIIPILLYQNRRVIQSLSIAVLIFFYSCDNSSTVTNSPVEANSIVSKYGQLSVDGTNIFDRNGNQIVLRGMSLFWSQWAPSYYNEETIKWLRDDWKCTVIRVPMGVEYGGYLENPEMEYWKIVTVVDACINLGLYVIVDWHDHNAEGHLEEAKEFFNNISQKYGDRENIIYEIYNEPLDVSWSNTLKPYSETIIAEIRKHDPDNIIVVGTPNWSQDVENVIENTINDVNVTYSFHFYTGTHRQWLREKGDLAMSAGIPLFVTEWGLSESDGSGNIDISETNLWLNYLEKNNLSWCNWSVTNKDETSAILLPSTTRTSNWEHNELSVAGQMIRDYLIRMNSGMFE